MSVTFILSLANRKATYIHRGKDTAVRIPQQPEREGEAPGLHRQYYVGDDELGVGPGQGSIRQPHRPGADEHAGEGVNQVVGFHHDSPTGKPGTCPRWRPCHQAEKTNVCSRARPCAAGKPGVAATEPCSGSTSWRPGYPVGRFQRPNVCIGEESLLTQAAT